MLPYSANCRGMQMMGCSSMAEQVPLTHSVESSSLSAPAIYIDADTCAQVTEEWWPGMEIELNGKRYTSTDQTTWSQIDPSPSPSPLDRIALALERIADALEDRVEDEPESQPLDDGIGEMMLDGTRIG